MRCDCDRCNGVIPDEPEPVMCKFCGHDWCSGIEYRQVDPFSEDVLNETIYVVMCDGAAYERAQDI